MDNNTPTQSTQPTQSKKSRLVTALVTVVAIFAGMIIGRVVMSNVLKSSPEKLVQQTVPKTKEQIKPPTKIDDNTTLTDIKANGDTVEYYYDLNGIASSLEFKDELKKKVTSQTCSTKETRNLLNKDVKLGYNYIFSETTEPFGFDVAKSDCSS